MYHSSGRDGRAAGKRNRKDRPTSKSSVTSDDDSKLVEEFRDLYKSRLRMLDQESMAEDARYKVRDAEQNNRKFGFA